MISGQMEPIIFATSFIISVFYYIEGLYSTAERKTWIRMMRYYSRCWLLIWTAISDNSFDEEFSSATVDGEEFTVSSGHAIVMYADHLPQAGGSGDEVVSQEELEKQLKSLAFSPSFKQIPAIWGLINHCTYTMYVDAYYVGTLRITVVDAGMTHQMVTKWGTNNHVANHYTSENEIPCRAA